jgi:hypothetical protein
MCILMINFGHMQYLLKSKFECFVSSVVHYIMCYIFSIGHKWPFLPKFTNIAHAHCKQTTFLDLCVKPARSLYMCFKIVGAGGWGGESICPCMAMMAYR